MAWAKNGTPETLGGTDTAVQITDLTAKIFNQFLRHEFKTGSLTCNSIFNNDTGSLYSNRISYSGGADGTGTSSAALNEAAANSANDEFHVMYSCWISGEEKLDIDFAIERSTAGSGTAPTRSEHVGKYVPSPLTDTCDRIDGVASTSTLAASSNLSAIGTD